MSKLVRCVRGTIVDVLVDIRRGSPTYGRWEAYELDDVGGRQLYAPDGFAHGFCVLSDVADVIYKCTVPYEADDDRGVAWNDPSIGINWPVDNPLLSAKDSA